MSEDLVEGYVDTGETSPSKEERDLLYKLEIQNAMLFTPIQSPRPAQEDEQEDVDWDSWGLLLTNFRDEVKKQQKTLVKKVHQGTPKALRGQLWFQMCANHPQSYLRQSEGFNPPEAFRGKQPEDIYQELLKQNSPQEKVIGRDLARTFPKHEFFKEAEGVGQEALFNVMKAYSIYDVAIGYCQGSGFIAATLLMHMPEEQAFACFVHLMHTYQLRNLFSPQMELLQLRLYQFDCLLQEFLPDVYNHLLEEGIKSTMYASQWFLTLFSYRFPLEVVFRLLDIIFATGIVHGVTGSEASGGVMDYLQTVSEISSSSPITQTPTFQRGQEVGADVAVVIFRYALSLLKSNEETIMALDFEPLVEFLKSGLFQVFAQTTVDETGKITFAESSVGSRQSSQKSLSPRDMLFPKAAIDRFVTDAMSSKYKIVTKKKLAHLYKIHSDMLKHTDPAYLQEKSKEGQITRLAADLKRSEQLLADLNKEHCELAGQMVTLRVELAKEKEQNQLLQRQVTDFKIILDRPQYKAEPAQSEGQELSQEEQLYVLQKQNAALLDEIYNLSLTNARQPQPESGWKKLFSP